MGDSYSASVEFKYPTNSFKSRLSGIVSRSFPNFKKHIDPLARGQLGTKEGIRLAGFFKAAPRRLRSSVLIGLELDSIDPRLWPGEYCRI